MLLLRNLREKKTKQNKNNLTSNTGGNIEGTSGRYENSVDSLMTERKSINTVVKVTGLEPCEMCNSCARTMTRKQRILTKYMKY